MSKRLGEMLPGSWDYNVDYEKAYRELVRLLQTEGKSFTKCYATVALIESEKL